VLTAQEHTCLVCYGVACYFLGSLTQCLQVLSVMILMFVNAKYSGLFQNGNLDVH
jgi:hypothetical protein